MGISVDFGISQCIQTLDSIAARRAARKENYISNLTDDLDATAEIVKTLDNLFIELVGGFQDPALTGDDLVAHLEQTWEYLSNRELLPRLEAVIGSLQASATHKRLRRNRQLVGALNALGGKLRTYRGRLGHDAMTGVGLKEEWNLMTLWERAQGFSADREVSPAHMAKEVHRNHDFSLSDAIHRLSGQAQALARG